MSEEFLQIAEKGGEAKGKRERERCTHLNAEVTIGTGHRTRTGKKKHGLVQNWERSMSRPYIVILLI